ncbi:MAG: amylo-alpha-1,6-glucosidase [Pyrinomonadaceae bacterium]
MIVLDKTVCSDVEQSASREWIETNGIGGFASGTVSGILTRRYHSLLAAATRPPLGRITTVAKLEETLVIDGVEHELSANRYPGTIHPRGFELIEEFRLDPFPIWKFAVDGVEIEKRVFMVNGRNLTVCRWSVRDLGPSARQIELRLRPLISFVDYHHLRRAGGEFSTDFASDGDLVTMRPVAEMPPLHLRHNGRSVASTGYWYRDFELAVESERGFDFCEDLFQPFELTFDMASDAVVMIECGDAPPPAVKKVDRLERSEIRRRRKLTASAQTEFERDLMLAADQFVVARGDGHTVIAGYPWFSDWGRDTMIALNGLTLATGRPTLAKEILLEFSRHVSQGMIPNRFPDEGEAAEYNTVDATLWYVEAVRAYAEASGDFRFVKKNLYRHLSDIVTWHLRGTRYRIHVDTDGLLYAGEPGVQLTWMDAKIGDLVVTPRTGKAVEIQALWYNALRAMADLAERFGEHDDRDRYRAMADLAELSFNAVFWNADEQCLFDVVENGHRDAAIRPNQILAVSLPYSMLDDERSRKVVEKVEAELLTPVGLRSLSPRDPAYVPRYIGGPFERDSAYHQGTVWAWLIGPFIDAYRRVFPDREWRVAEILDGFRPHLSEAGLGQISEIFDAEPPHAPRGCPAQAWSVAEVLRVMRSGRA